MMYTALLLGLLPLLFLSDMFSPGTEVESDEDDSNPDGYDSHTITDTSNGDMLDGLTSGDGDGSDDILAPVEEDEAPSDPVAVDPDSILSPNTDDDIPPDTAEPVDGPVLDPADTPDEEFRTDGDGTLLQQLLDEQSDATTGVGFLGTRITDTDDITLSDDADTLELEDDGVDGTGNGLLHLWDGTPLVESEAGPVVVDGGAGDDVISTGDDAAYAFGGAGDDDISVGEGVGALFGGDGADTLSGSDVADPDGSATAYLDGGAGDDLIIGGDAHEILEGGVHKAGTGEADDDTLSGGGGNDSIRGGYGADVLNGGDGDDVIDHLGNAGERISAEHHEFTWHIDGESDVLDGGAGDDILIMDGGDFATGGAGNDTFWVYFDESAGNGFAEVSDFETGTDFLRVELNPDLGFDQPQIDVAPSADGADGVVTINGHLVAILRGAPDASAADLYVSTSENVFG